MGKSLSRIVSEYIPNSVTDVYNNIGNTRKRKYSSDEDEANLEESLHFPKKRKLICTTQYIYKALFIDGRNHDIVVDALGKEWRLHKVYLTQSPYFQSMFSGSWKETNNKYIKIEVADPNISVDALSLVLGSLYQDEVSIEPAGVVGVLAAATMFQLDGLIDECLSIMAETISPLTAISYYEAASQYGLQRIKQVTTQWFLINLMTYYPYHTKRLRQIEPDLMTQLVHDKDLVVVSTEYSLYTLLRFWVFIRLHPHWHWESDPDKLQVTEFFHNRPDSSSFLLSPEGKEYLRVFRGLRGSSLLVEVNDIELLTKDRILPESWLFPELKRHWTSLLRVDVGQDQGPSELTPELFFSSCVRCGRMLESPDVTSWKWKLFNFGLDLVWSIQNNIFTVRRSNDDGSLLDNRARTVMLRVTISTLDSQRQTKLTQSSGIVSVLLVRNLEARIMDMCTEFEYPMIVSVNFLSVTPESSAATSK